MTGNDNNEQQRPCDGRCENCTCQQQPPEESFADRIARIRTEFNACGAELGMTQVSVN
jgi:hypothetical protein